MSPHLPERPQVSTSPSAVPTPTATVQPAASSTGGSTAIDTSDGETTSSDTTIVNPNSDRGDLYRGSLTRKLAAGDQTVVVDYWMDADPKTLSATTPTVVKLSAHLEDGKTTNGVKVSRFLASADDGTSSATLSDDRGEFVITAPYSYGTALTVRPGNASATSVTLSIQFELLIETAPDSGAYSRQTVLDSVRIALPATPRGTAS